MTAKTHVVFYAAVLISCCYGCVGNSSSSDIAWKVWFSPSTTEPSFREDGEGPFAPAWPVAAVAVDAQPDSLWGGMLFVLSGPDLSKENAAAHLIDYTRLAVPCNFSESMDCRWLATKVGPNRILVVVYPSGGSGGDHVEIFRRSCLYDCDVNVGDVQINSFYQELERTSCLRPYIADYDGDGFCEIFVASEESCVNDPHMDVCYEMYHIQDDQLSFDREMSQAELAEIEARIPLGILAE